MIHLHLCLCPNLESPLGSPRGLMDTTVPSSHTNSLSSLPCHIVMKPAAFSCLFCLVCGLVYSPLALLTHALHCCFLPSSEAGIYFSKTDSGYLLNVCQDFASQLYQSCSAITRGSPAVPRTPMYPGVQFEGQLFTAAFAAIVGCVSQYQYSCHDASEFLCVFCSSASLLPWLEHAVSFVV